MNYLGWACGLADFDNSGKRDFWTANGHVYPTDKDYNEPITIFRSLGSKTELAYQYPAKPNNSYRGGATADFNNDGKMDLLILPIAGSPVLLKNDTPEKNNWLGLQLRGTRSNRDAIGAIATIVSCGQKQSDAVRSGGSYLSRSDTRLHFGVGPCQQIEQATIQWPTGKTQMVNNLPLNRYITIEEPK